MSHFSGRIWIAAGLAICVLTGLWLTVSSSVPVRQDEDRYNAVSFGREFSTDRDTLPQNSVANRSFTKYTQPINPSQTNANAGKAGIAPQIPVQVGQQIHAGIQQFRKQWANSPSSNWIAGSQARLSNSSISKRDQAIADLKKKLGDNASFVNDDLSQTLRYLDGDLQKLAEDSLEYREALLKGDFGGMALALAGQIPAVLNIQNPVREFFAEDIATDELGMTHVILQQQYRGAPVWGAELGVHFNAEQEPFQISGVYAPTPQNIPDSDPVIGQQQAIEAARKAIGQQGPGLREPKVQRMVYWDLGRQPVLCWNVELLPSYVEAWEIFVSATDGSIVHRYNKIVSANVKATAPDLVGQNRSFNCWEWSGKYSAIDTTLPMYDPANSQPPDVNKLKGVILGLDFKNQDPRQEGAQFTRIDSDRLNQWDPACVTLMYYYPIIENYYRQTYGRNSIDNKGLNIDFAIHFRWPAGDQIGQTHNENACWNPAMNMMFYGDGDQLGGGKLPHGMDIVAHEYTHGVTGFEAGLIYETQSGALDEAFSDFFACMIDREDWLLAEDIVPFGVNKDKIAMRDMSYPGNPKVTDRNPAVMAEYRSLPIDQDQGGVHINCGIPSYMLYLLTEGGPYAIGKEKAEKITYRARNEYLTQRSQFIDFRLAMVSAAKDLYGDGSAEMDACKKAADAVGITEAATPSQPPSTPGQAVQGDEMIIFLAGNYMYGMDPIRNDVYYNLFLHGTGPNGAVQNLLLTQRLAASTRPAVSGDGQWALYVDAINNIVITNGFQEQNITNIGVVRTIAMDMGQRFVSYTTINYDNNLYLIDLKEKDSAKAVKTIPLRVPLNSEYASTVDLSYADVMTFNFRGDHLLFDAVQKIPLASGGTKEAWGLYSLRIADLQCGMVMPPQSDTQFGNPIFAHTDDNLLLADLVTGEGEKTVYQTALFQFAEKKIGILIPNTGLLSRPTFRGDDKRVIFRTIDIQKQQYLLVEGTLTNDKMGFVNGSLNAVVPAQVELNHPIAFRSGTYVLQEGKIAVPATIDFGSIPAGQATQKTVIITNSGNADLNVLSISLEGTNAEWFRHDGLNRLVSPGGQYPVTVQCQPQQEGNFAGVLRIKSTDVQNPNVTVELRGTGQPSAQATPTPTATPVTIFPTPTMTPTPVPTPTPTTAAPSTIEPIAAYEFDRIDLAGDGWTEIPGGFGGAPAGKISANSFIGSRIPSSVDKAGLMISVQPKQVAFIHATNPVNTGGGPVLIRASVRTDAAGAAVALAALKGNLSTGEAVDSSIATNIPASAGEFVAGEGQLTLVYEPDNSNWVTPILQVAAAASLEGTVNVFIDRVDVVKLEVAASYTGGLFGSVIGGGGLAAQATEPALAMLYEFDQIDLTANGWTAIPGGFGNAVPGDVAANSFVGSSIASSKDKVGLQIAADPGEVAFIHATQPVQTNGAPLLLRAVVRARDAGASVALAALKGNLSTGEHADGSIATHIPASSVSMVDGERTLTLVCPSNSAGVVTPILQVLGTGASATTVLADRLEVYRLDLQTGCAGGLFAATP